MIFGDKAKMEFDAAKIGIKTSIKEFLILEHDKEPLVMGVQWHSSLVGENCSDSTRLVNIWIHLVTRWANALDAIEDKAEEDQILDNANLDVYPEAVVEEPEAYNQCVLTLVFWTKTRSSQWSVGMANSFQPFDKEGLRV